MNATIHSIDGEELVPVAIDPETSFIAEVNDKQAKMAALLGAAFWHKVDRTGECWLWTGRGDAGGYGRVHYDGRDGYAHRLAYELLVGAIPDGLVIDHLCRVRNCVNPAHLEVVTQRENILRSDGAGAVNARKTHCKRGHEFTPENTIRIAQGRNCRTCLRMLQREWARKRRAAIRQSQVSS